MQLINNRYRIKDTYKVYDDSTIFTVHDLWNNNEELLLKLLSGDKNATLIDEFIHVFIEISSLKHKGIISNHSFDIVNSIDNKPTIVKQYFYTMDYVNSNKLTSYIGRLNIEQILSIVVQLLEVVSYLAFRGYPYRYINPDNIFVIDDRDNFKIKLNDFAEIILRERKNIYNDEYSDYMAPEARYNNANNSSDIYSIGMLLKTMLIGKAPNLIGHAFKAASHLKLNKNQEDLIDDLISRLVNKDLSLRLVEPTEIVNEINKIFGKDYRLNLKESRNKLIFNHPIVGRDREINIVLDIDKNIGNNNLDKKLISFTGEDGIGKTRLLEELEYRLRMRGRTVFYTSITDSNAKELSGIIKILRSMIKDCDSYLIEKYGCELVKIIPEISESGDIKPSSMLSGTRERLRLYDRITNFIIDNIKNNPTYILIDDLHNSDIETINLLNYLINSGRQVPLILIASYHKDMLEKKKALNDTINTWIKSRKAHEYRLFRLNLNETSDLIKSILGISYKAINFSTRVMNETLGNPGYIEEAIKNLVATGELFINEKGNWDVPTKNYASLYIPSNIGDAIKRQIKLLDKELYDIAKYISIFNTSVSKTIIRKLAEDYGIDSDQLVDKLASMKILDERVEDWGYTYDFYNRQIKMFIYSDIKEDEKQELHRKAAEILEQTYIQQDRGNVDELIYHYNMSKQLDKAIKHTILNAKKMKGLVGNIQCIHLWENANELMKGRRDIHKLEVLTNLGSLYLLHGMTGKSINCYKEGLKIAEELKENKYIAICNKGLSSVFLRRYDMDLAEKHADQAKKISQEHDYTEELLESIRNLYKIYISKGEYDIVLEHIDKYLDMAKEHDFDLYAGYLYNHKGIIKAFTDQIEQALDYFVTSYQYLQKSGDLAESTRALNNIGSIYSEYFDDIDLAMAYFKEGLEITKKYQSLETEGNFLNNIGELYFRTNDYALAKEYIKKVENIAKDIEDEGLLFLSYINLGLIYLRIGQFDKCYKLYEKVKKTFDEGFVEEQYISRYYYFLGEFYFTFGVCDKALEYFNKTIESCNQLENILKLDSYLKKVLLEYCEESNATEEDIENVRELYRLSGYCGERRRALLTLANTLMIYDNDKLAEDLLLEDNKLIGKYTTKYLDILRDMTIGKLNKDYEQLTNVSKRVKNSGHYRVELFNYVELGDICFENKQYYKSANYYLTALDLLYRLTRKIPNKKLQVNFVKKNMASEIISKLNKIVLVIKGDNALNINTIEFTEAMELEDYFNIKKIVELFNENIFNFDIKEDSDPSLKGVYSFEELILQLSNNYNHNLNMILKYAVDKTYANRGIICVHDYESGELVTVASTSEDDFIPEEERILSEVKKKNRGILINKSFDYEEQEQLQYVDDNIKAIICMPIFKLQASEHIEEVAERRKSYTHINNEDIIGYLYLDTDKLFNKFDNKRLKIIDALSHLISINIDNYILKIISSIDKMTGAYTRKYFDSIFKDFILLARRSGTEFSVIMLDLDKFKNVNDTFGHRMGDEILNRIGNIILKNIRKTDMVGRYGGEEFIIILPNTNKDQGKKIAEKIRKAVEKTVMINEDYPITISLGISSFPDHGQTPDELIEKADQALYNAKELGRNKSIIWSDDIGKSNKRLDKLAGIITGNTVHDQRIGLVLVEIIELMREKSSKEDKIFRILGRLIEILEAEKGTLIIVDKDQNIQNIYGRQRFLDIWAENPECNDKVIYEIINEQIGKFFIDWEDIRGIDLVTGKPNWLSIIAVPLINNGEIKGVLQITVPIKEKEFDYNSYNFVNTISDIIAAML